MQTNNIYMWPIFAIAMFVSVLSGAVFSCYNQPSTLHYENEEHNKVGVAQCVHLGGVPIFDTYHSGDDPIMVRCDDVPVR